MPGTCRRSPYFRCAFLQRSNNGYEHFLVRRLQEPSKHRYGACPPDGVLVLRRLAATPQREGARARNFDVFSDVRRQGGTVKQSDLRR